MAEYPKVKLDLLSPCSFFRYSDDLIYCLGGKCKGRERECHPVTQGQFGPDVQDNIDVWLSADEEISLIPWHPREADDGQL